MLSKEKRRNQILEAAGSQFLAHGFAGSSMQGIAKAAGISRASLYTYFGNKEEVFQAVLKLLDGFICQDAKRAVAALGRDAPFETRLIAAFETRQATWFSFTKTQSSYAFELLQLRAESAAQDEKTAFEKLIEQMLTDAKTSDDLPSQGAAPPTQDLVAILMRSSGGIALFEGDSLAEKRRLLRVLIQSFLRGL